MSPLLIGGSQGKNIRPERFVSAKSHRKTFLLAGRLECMVESPLSKKLNQEYFRLWLTRGEICLSLGDWH
jgi:hypothetical protein